ncbi:MAG: prolyl oligopeptidase family serine peptidase, partial [Archangium sp.]
MPLTSFAGAKGAVPPPPVAAKKPVVDTYHGVKVDDPYQWLEKSDDPEVRQWIAGQTAHMRAVLDKLPSRDAIRERITALLSYKSSAYFIWGQRGGLTFGTKSQPPKQQPLLVVLSSVDDPASERVLLDPAELDPSGHTTIDFFVPSLDGKKVAVSLSKNGTESGDITIFDVATGKPLAGEVVVPRVNGGTAGGSLTWNADGTGYFYTRYPRGEERPAADLDFFQQVYFHKLGTPTEQDTYELGKDFPRIANTKLRTSEDGSHVLAIMGNGDGAGAYALYLRGPTGTWTQLSKLEDKLAAASFGQ